MVCRYLQKQCLKKYYSSRLAKLDLFPHSFITQNSKLCAQLLGRPLSMNYYPFACLCEPFEIFIISCHLSQLQLSKLSSAVHTNRIENILCSCHAHPKLLTNHSFCLTSNEEKVLPGWCRQHAACCGNSQVSWHFHWILESLLRSLMH